MAIKVDDLNILIEVALQLTERLIARTSRQNLRLSGVEFGVWLALCKVSDAVSTSKNLVIPVSSAVTELSENALDPGNACCEIKNLNELTVINALGVC